MPDGLDTLARQTHHLDFGRTVERSLVHRTAVSEVFVTDVVPLAERTVRAGAQLPLIHGYYSDHLQAPALYDALLLLETGRQAAIAGSHTHIGLSSGTMMIVDTFSFALERLPDLVVRRDPVELRIDTEYIGKPKRTGRYRKGTVAQEFFVDDQRVAQHTMNVLFVNRHENEILRHAQRGTPAPLTSDLPWTVPDGHLAPHLVGRANSLNVVLAHCVVADGRLTARVAPRYDNPSLFDHDYDHLPAMTLVEAARQLALLCAGEATDRRAGEAALTTYFVGVDATFSRFAELDAPVTASTELPPAGTLPSAVDVRFTQDGGELAVIRVCLADVSLVTGE